MKTLIIAEAGVNHNGDLDMALQLCKAAKEAGADIVKFQTFRTENILTKDATLAPYQAENIGVSKNQFAMIKELELDFSSFKRIKEYCDKIGIQFLSTPDDEDSLDFLVDELGMKTIKIGSGEISNIPFLRKIGIKRLPIILSTGMATLGEIERAVYELEHVGSGDITLMHCTSSYPCPFNEVNLRAMHTISEAFGYKVGYSDHTQGIIVPIAAVALGAVAIEKHFTLDKKLPGPDHLASIEPNELRLMIESIRNIEVALGDGKKRPSQSEKATKEAVRRSIVAACPIKKGTIFSYDNITTKRTGQKGLPSEMWDYVIGRLASRDFSEDEPICL